MDLSVHVSDTMLYFAAILYDRSLTIKTSFTRTNARVMSIVVNGLSTFCGGSMPVPKNALPWSRIRLFCVICLVNLEILSFEMTWIPCSGWLEIVNFDRWYCALMATKKARLWNPCVLPINHPPQSVFPATSQKSRTFPFPFEREKKRQYSIIHADTQQRITSIQKDHAQQFISHLHYYFNTVACRDPSCCLFLRAIRFGKPRQ